MRVQRVELPNAIPFFAAGFGSAGVVDAAALLVSSAHHAADELAIVRLREAAANELVKGRVRLERRRGAVGAKPRFGKRDTLVRPRRGALTADG